MKNHFDVIVVGGGILGVAHAYWALKQGLTVGLFEKDIQPQEATVRNFGQVVPSGLPANEWQEYGKIALETYKSIQSEYDLTVRTEGSTYIASNAQEVGLLEELSEINKASNYPSILWTAKQCLDHLPDVKTEYCKAALHFPEEVTVEAPLMIHKLLAYLGQKFDSFHYFPDTTVVACVSNQETATIETLDKRSCTAEHVIICNGRDFKYLFPALFRKSNIKVVKLNMMESFPYENINLKGNILTGLTIRRYEAFEQCASFSSLDNSVYDQAYFDWGIHLLFKQTPENTLIIGDSHEYETVATASNLGYSINEHLNQLIVNEAARILDVSHWNIQRTWTGFYTQLNDAQIYERTIDEKIHIRTGIGGKGMSTSLGYAKISLSNILK